MNINHIDNFENIEEDRIQVDLGWRSLVLGGAKVERSLCKSVTEKGGLGKFSIIRGKFQKVGLVIFKEEKHDSDPVSTMREPL